MKKLYFAGLIAVAMTTTAVLAAGGTSVYINGAKFSHVKVISGTAYIPLADVAKAYNSSVVKRSDGDYEIAAAGGANQVGKYQGKIGEEVFTGQYKFSVVSVQEATSYSMKFRTNPDTLTAENSNQKLVVVNCRIKNGTTARQTLIMAVGGEYGAPNTALTDSDEQSYPTINWHGDATTGGVDVREDEHAPLGTKILPGAACNVTLVFLVPKDSKPKDMVFSLTPYSEWTKGAKKKFTDVRINLNTP